MPTGTLALTAIAAKTVAALEPITIARYGCSSLLSSSPCLQSSVLLTTKKLLIVDFII
jgi:hypothetical protein